MNLYKFNYRKGDNILTTWEHTRQMQTNAQQRTIFVRQEYCLGCAGCYKSCPSDVLSMNPFTRQAHVIAQHRCLADQGCDLCVRSCAPGACVIKSPAQEAAEQTIKRQQAMDSNNSLQELSQMVGSYPDEVLSNPALPLLALEDPIRYQGMLSYAQRTINTRDIYELWKTLTVQQRWRFAIDCAEHVLPQSSLEPLDKLRCRRMLALVVVHIAGSPQKTSWWQRLWQRLHSSKWAQQYLESPDPAPIDFLVTRQALSHAQHKFGSLFAEPRNLKICALEVVGVVKMTARETFENVPCNASHSLCWNNSISGCSLCQKNHGSTSDQEKEWQVQRLRWYTEQAAPR
jgi:Fe-S-cluster-containing dehydrogenase component